MDVAYCAGHGLFLLLRGAPLFIGGQFFLCEELFRHVLVALQRGVAVVGPVPRQVRHAFGSFAGPRFRCSGRGRLWLSTLGLTSHRLRRHQSGCETNGESRCA
jgi:hypothetical protein